MSQLILIHSLEVEGSSYYRKRKFRPHGKSFAQSYISCKLAIRPLGLLYFTGPLFKKCIVKMMYLYQKMITLGTRMMSSYHLPLYFTFTKFMDKNSWFVKYKLQKGSLKLSVQVPKAASFISYWDQDENNLLYLNLWGYILGLS